MPKPRFYVIIYTNEDKTPKTDIVDLKDETHVDGGIERILNIEYSECSDIQFMPLNFDDTQLILIDIMLAMQNISHWDIGEVLHSIMSHAINHRNNLQAYKP